MQIESFWQGQHIVSFFPRDIEIMGWCPTGPVLPHQGESASLALIGYPSSAGVTIKILYGVDVSITSTSLTPHLFQLSCLNLNLILLEHLILG